MRDPLVLDEQLETRIARMDFFHVLRLIENAHPELPRIGSASRPQDEAVRFGQHPAMSFHASALSQYHGRSADARARLAINFMGLLGANGPLPIHLTEYVRDRLRNGSDGTLLAFFDVFHHRMVSLFYRARAVAEPTINLDRVDADRFSIFVGSLFGIGAPALRERDDIGDFAKLHFAGLLANKSRPAAGLATILREYFHLPLRIEQFVGHWMRLPAEIHSHIGARERDNRLGASLVLGRSVWDCQHKFRIIIGPMSYEDYQRFMPGGGSLRRLLAWVKQYAGLTLNWDVQLILQQKQIPPLRLGGARLGCCSRLISKPPDQDCARMLIGKSAIENSVTQARH
ncbi:MAG: type VI secretion system baseplate subunit TssG [Yersinia sp. (in: enterobacteria)]